MKNILKNIMVIILLLAFTTLGFRNESSTKISAVEKKDKYIVFVKQKKEIPMELQSKEVILPELNEEILEEKKIGVVNMTNVEVKKWEKETEPKMRIIKESEDKSDYTIFGLDSRKFEIVGGYEDAVALRKLMDKKHMDHDEIELIVGCLKLK